MSGIIRFAPSPTGYLHEGHLLSALYVWAAAKKWGLKVHLRIEDHDQSRARPAYIEGIREDLAWLGFHYDSESIQSKRTAIYESALRKLEAKSLVYPCYCSRKQLLAENPQSETGEIIYQGKCFFRRETGDAPHSLRFIVPDKVIYWHDLRLGDFHENPKLQCGDFPIRDREGQWTYQFAVCVDDIDENITHIVRGEDIRSSTARQIALMEALGRTERPIYLHHPLIVDENNKKLSKRELAHSLSQDKEAGITPEMLFGRVCHKAHLTESNAPISLQEASALVAHTLPSL
ncbi:MAG: hypothetical protein IKN03_00130 [Fibrobacter sp.]|nr:hypothetical protein [Fibrobacter sp.]